MASHDTMMYWLAQACKEARKAAGRMQVHVAASASVDQSTVNRFENATAWSRNTDLMVAAYADDLDVEPVQLWEQAVRLWQEDLALDPKGEASPERSQAARTLRKASRRRGENRGKRSASGGTQDAHGESA